MTSHSRFLGLPRELRDIIYQHYVTDEDGYIFNFGSGKLRASNNQPIDLALMHTCKQVSEEMRGVALKTNTIVFSTIYSHDLRSRAGRFDIFTHELRRLKTGLFSSTRPCITSDVSKRVARKYPQFIPVLDRLRVEGNSYGLTSRYWGEAPSVHRDFIDYTLELVSARPDFTETIEPEYVYLWTDDLEPAPYELISLRPTLWAIPTEDEITEIMRIIGLETARYLEDQEYWDREKYVFSAAVAAIQFLHSVPDNTRAHIRRILLLEDYEAVAFPECHAQGLISFCLENPLLRVERRVDLWRNAFPANSTTSLAILTEAPPELRRDFGSDQLKAVRISKSFAVWIEEALALVAAGMPAKSFSLVFDGNPIPGKSSQVFEVAKRDAAWQSALDECYSRGLLPTPSYFDRRIHSCYISESFPKVLGEIVHKTSFIHCNFEMDDLWDVEQVVEENRGWSVEEWETNWRKHKPDKFEPAPPLPKWRDLRLERVLPK